MSKELSKQDQAVIIKALWESLQAPKWTKDDLIDFGKAIFSKQSLKEMDKGTFGKILPFLNTISSALADKLLNTPAPASATSGETDSKKENSEESRG